MAHDDVVPQRQQDVAEPTLNGLPYDVKLRILFFITQTPWSLDAHYDYYAIRKHIFGSREAYICRISRDWYHASLKHYARVARIKAREEKRDPRRLDQEFHFPSQLTYIMSEESLARLATVARNSDLRPFVTSVRYIGFDYPKSTARENKFVSNSNVHYRWKPSRRYNRLRDEDGGDRHHADYREHLAYWSAHQRVLRSGPDLQVLNQFLPLFQNLRMITFERFDDWRTNDRRFMKYGEVKSLPEHVRPEPFGPLATPVYWRGFFNLASAASSLDYIDALSLRTMVLDLASTDESGKTVFSHFLKQIEYLHISCMPDYVVRGPRSRCVTGWNLDNEKKTWSLMLNNCNSVQTLFVEINQEFPNEYTEERGTFDKMHSELANLILGPPSAAIQDANLSRFSKLSCIEIKNLYTPISSLMALFTNNRKTLFWTQLHNYRPAVSKVEEESAARTDDQRMDSLVAHINAQSYGVQGINIDESRECTGLNPVMSHERTIEAAEAATHQEPFVVDMVFHKDYWYWDEYFNQAVMTHSNHS